MNDFLTIVLEYVMSLFIASIQIFAIVLGTATILFIVVVMLVYIYALITYLVRNAVKDAKANIAVLSHGLFDEGKGEY